MSSGTDQTYIRPQGQINWRPTDRISIGISGGIDQRDFEQSDVSSSSTPLYSGSIQYRPFKTTTLELQASRNLRESYSANENIKSSGWSASLEQRLLGRVYLHTNFTQNRSRYMSTAAQDIAVRYDKYYSFNCRLSTPLSRRGSFTVLYQHNDNSSQDTGYSFTSHQIGCELEFRF